VVCSYVPAMLVAAASQTASVWVTIGLLTISVTLLANGISLRLP
jgi:hypothetical protein